LSHAAIAHSRRAVYANGSARMYGRTSDPTFSYIEGVSDHSVDVLFFWRDDGRLEGMAINVYCPAQEVEGEKCLSATSGTMQGSFCANGTTPICMYCRSWAPVATNLLT